MTFQKRLVSRAAALVLVAGTIFAQQQFGGFEFSPVPIYRGDDNIVSDASLNGKTVFYDLLRREIVISLTDAQQPNGRQVLRFERRNQVEPEVQSSVRASGNGGYAYTYSVQNAPKAVKRMNNIAVSVGAGDTTMSVSHPLWAATTVSSDLVRPGSIRPEVLVIWSAGTQESYVAIGRTLSQFQIVSRYRPGLVIGYAQSAAGALLTDTAVKRFPIDVQQQLALVNTPHWNAAQFMTIAPKFAVNDPRLLVATDFQRAISQLSIQGPLTPNSAFVSAALTSLKLFTAAPEGTRLDLQFLAKASTGLEKEIAEAIQISLQ